MKMSHNFHFTTKSPRHEGKILKIKSSSLCSPREAGNFVVKFELLSLKKYVKSYNTTSLPLFFIEVCDASSILTTSRPDSKSESGL